MNFRNSRRGKVLRQAALAAVACAGIADVQAFRIDTGNPDLKLNWDNTVKYSTAFRIKGQSEGLTEAANEDDGDRNFDRGLISNRVDLLSEFDLTYKGFGARVSGAAWYDTAYNRSNDHDSPATANQLSVPYDEFTSDTEKLHGRKAELLDAFIFGRFELGQTRATFRVGRHSLIWGESLFLGANGIAAGQASVDIAKAQSVPNTQFKELIRPIEQISGQVQITPEVSVGAYYQWRWEKNRFPAVGSYFSTNDVFGEGAERLLFFGPFAATKAKDIEAKDSGQGGVQVRFRVGETDYGLYAIRYHDRSPQLYLRGLLPGTPPGVNLPGQFLWVYPENITAFGASFSHTFGEFNVAGEASIRRNMPLSSDSQLDLFGIVPPAFGGPSAAADNDDNPLYAVGRTAHAQISWLASLGPNFLAREASFLGEIGWNRTLSVTKNRDALNPNADRDAWNVRMVYEPSYRQVFPGVDLSVPVGLGFGIGNSSAVGSAFMGDRAGDVSVGINAVYVDAWRFSVNYTRFFGPEGTFLDEDNHISFKQALKDRDFISLSVRRTF